MLGHLIRKDILDHILSLRFLVLSLIGALTIWLSLYDGYAYYQVRLVEYRLAEVTKEERIKHLESAEGLSYNPVWVTAGIGFEEHKPSTLLCIFIRGLDPTLGRAMSTGYTKVRRLRRSPVETEPVLGVFPPLDLGLVVEVVLSLFVVLLTYDAVCGEKKGGTLRLTASFPVPGYRFVLGKLLGVLIPTLAAFGLPLLLGISVLIALPGVQMTGLEWMRLGVILAAFGIYLAVFACAGLLASCLTHRSATSFVLLLTFWVAAVVVVPRLSLIVADQFRPAPSIHEHQAQVRSITSPNSLKWREMGRKWREEQERIRPPRWLNTPEGREADVLNYQENRDRVQAESRPKVDQLERRFSNLYQVRLDLAVLLARISPAFAFKNATVNLAGTGIERHRRFNDTFVRYVMDQYFAWVRVWSDGNSLKRANPDKYGRYEWDISGFPRFIYREAWPEDELHAALVDVGVLALWGLLFFTGAFVATLRYDVR